MARYGVAAEVRRQDIEFVARTIGVSEDRVRRELAGAVRRSEPDAREVYGQIEGIRFVARRQHSGAPWWISLEKRVPPWERMPHTGWSG